MRGATIGEDSVKEEEEKAESTTPEADSKVAVQGKALKRNKYGRFVVKFGMYDVYCVILS